MERNQLLEAESLTGRAYRSRYVGDKEQIGYGTAVAQDDGTTWFIPDCRHVPIFIDDLDDLAPIQEEEN